jgi:hypothetical protein
MPTHCSTCAAPPPPPPPGLTPEVASTLEELQAQVAKLKRTRDKLMLESQELVALRQAHSDMQGRYKELKVRGGTGTAGERCCSGSSDGHQCPGPYTVPMQPVTAHRGECWARLLVVARLLLWFLLVLRSAARPQQPVHQVPAGAQVRCQAPSASAPSSCWCSGPLPGPSSHRTKFLLVLRSAARPQQPAHQGTCQASTTVYAVCRMLGTAP